MVDSILRYLPFWQIGEDLPTFVVRGSWFVVTLPAVAQWCK